MSHRSEFFAQQSLDPTAQATPEIVIDGTPVPSWDLVPKADHYQPTRGGYAIGYRKPEGPTNRRFSLFTLILGGKS